MKKNVDNLLGRNLLLAVLWGLMLSLPPGSRDEAPEPIVETA